MFSSGDSSEADELSRPVPGNESARKKNQSNQSPGANVIKLFTAVSYDFSLKARAFIPGKPFQPSLMFAGKAGAYPRVEHLQGASLG
jgi:hypothetical protein